MQARLEPARLARLEPAFLDGFQHGRRFALWVRPLEGAGDRGSILCVQPFGEEANLSRRVLVAQAVRLAAMGWTTLLLDPFGTGDSDGRTDEATFPDWRADLLRASRLARERSDGPFVLWGLRMGALLAAELAIALDQLAAAMVFWQPPASGAQLTEPLLKLAKVGAVARSAAGGAYAASATRSSPASPASPASSTAPASPASPVSPANPAAPANPVAPVAPVATAPAPASDLVDLAGHRLRRDLVDALGAMTMQPPSLGEHATPCPVLMLGIQRLYAAGSPAPRPLAQAAERWLHEGYLASLRVVQGEPFWASLEPSLPLAAFQETEAFLEGVDARR